METIETRFSHFSERDCILFKKKFEGKTCFRFDISFVEEEKDYTLIVRSNNTDYTATELREVFIRCCMVALADILYMANR